MKITARTGATWGGVAGLGSLRRKLVRAVTNKWDLYRMYRIAHTRRQAIVWMLERESF